MAKRRSRRSAGPGAAAQQRPAASSPAEPPSTARQDRARQQERTRPVTSSRTRRRAAATSGGLDPWRIGILGVVLVGIVVVVAAVITSGGAASNYSCAQQLPDSGSPTDGQSTANQGRGHVATGARLEYLLCPPASGPHYSESGVAPARAGFYAPDSDIGPGSWVHNLEHGYVIALYRCSEGVCPPETDLVAMRRFVNEGPQTPSAARCGVRSKVLAARFDDMAAPFALVTWDRVLLLEAFDPDVALDFAGRWMEVGAPEASNC